MKQEYVSARFMLYEGLCDTMLHFSDRGVRLFDTLDYLLMALGEVLIAININSKSAIHIARVYGERMRNFVVQYFWARGYFVSTVGRDEGVIRKYIRDQENEDERLDQFNLV